jgi:hypothetical protein
MFGEFNLFQEGETLIEFAASPIGLHPLFDVVPVRHHSPRCLIEGVAVGQSIPKALDDPAIREDVKVWWRRVHARDYRILLYPHTLYQGTVPYTIPALTV